MAVGPMWHGAAGSGRVARSPSSTHEHPREFARVRAPFHRLTGGNAAALGDNAPVLGATGASLSPNHGDDEAFLRPKGRLCWVRLGCDCVRPRGGAERSANPLSARGWSSDGASPSGAGRRPMLGSSIALRKFEFYAIQNEWKIESASAGGSARRASKSKIIFLFESALTH